MGTRCPHLTSPEQFKAVLKHAPVASTPHFALHLSMATPPAHTLPARQTPSEAVGVGEPQPSVKSVKCLKSAIGVVVPKRLAKRAVTRNALRRQIYATFDAACRGWANGQAIWLVLRLRQGFSVAEVGASASSNALKRLARAELTQLANQFDAQANRLLRKAALASTPAAAC
jgi:ribonuclease P protein component